MSDFKYSEHEKEHNKVLKYNQDISTQILQDTSLLNSRRRADDSIASSEELLKSLGYEEVLSSAKMKAENQSKTQHLEHRPRVQSWEEILAEAEKYVPTEVTLEELLTPAEIQTAYRKQKEIETEFSNRTGIVNKTDLCFLAAATALQVVKALLFPYVAESFGYGQSFDPAERLAHNDKSIKQAQKSANDQFRDKRLQHNKAGYWINILYQTPPYDTTVGSKALGINMGGGYHRLYTLGHDPILGWLFGTANILTDVVTLNDFRSYRVQRYPKLRIMPEMVSLGNLFLESYEAIQDDFLNLPAAIFAQAQHLKSDVYTKVGLPVPLLSTFNENLASSLYKNQYDALCFSRDARIVGASGFVSVLVDMIITLTHGLFRGQEEKELYEVRTRKILLISNGIASTSSMIRTYITKNPKDIDLGGLLNTIAHLFVDVRFITKIKEEFIENRIYDQLRSEMREINQIYQSL